MDFYKTIGDLKNPLMNLLKVPSFGKSFICIDDQINRELIKNIRNKIFYTHGKNLKSNFLIKNIFQKKE